MSTIDNVAVVANTADNSYSGAFTVSGADRVLYVAAAFDVNTAVTFASVTYNSVALSPIGNTETLGRSVYLFRLIAPDTGANTLLVDWNGAYSVGTVKIYAVSLTGVDQTTPNRALVTTGNAGSANASISSITSDANDLALSFIYINNLNITGVTDDGAQTRQAAEGTNGAAILSSKTGASPNVSLSYTHASQSWGAIGLSVQPSAAPSSTTINVDIPADIDLEWGTTHELAVTHDGGTTTLSGVTLSAPTGWETVSFSTIPDTGTTESFYEYSQSDVTVGNFTAQVGDTLAFTSATGLTIDGSSIPVVNPAATVTGSYKWWDASLSTWTPVSSYTITNLGVFGGGDTTVMIQEMISDMISEMVN